MSIYSLPAFFAFAINVSLVVILILNDPKSRTHRLFALLIGCFALLNAADIAMVNSRTPDAASAAGAVIGAGLLFSTTFNLILSFSFPREIKSTFGRWPVRLMFLIPPVTLVIPLALQWFHPLEIRRLADTDVYSYVVSLYGGPWNGVMYALIFVYLAWALGNLITQVRGSRVRGELLKIVHLLLGTIVFAAFIVVLDVLHTTEKLHFYASRVLLLLISLFFAYVVLGSRLFVLRQLGKQGLVYSLVTGTILGFYVIIITNVADVVGRQIGVRSFVVEALLILLLALFFRPLIVQVQRLTEQLFYKHLFRYRQRFIRFTREAFAITNVSSLSLAVTAFLRDTLFATDAEVMLLADDSQRFTGILSPARQVSADGCLGRIVKQEEKAHEVSALIPVCSGEEQTLLAAFRGGYILPLLGEKDPTGVLLIGRPAAAKTYTLDEVEFFSIFANEVAIALERNLLMAKMRREEVRTAQMEKLAALGRLTAGIAHEFRNPLNIIATSAQLIIRRPGEEELHRETARYITEETDRLARTIDAFLEFAKPHSPVWERVHIGDIFKSVGEHLQARISGGMISLRTSVEDGAEWLMSSPDHLHRILTNLGLNAIEAMPSGGDLFFAARRKTDGRLLLEVRDTGGGISPDHQSRLFDPFFTTKPTGTGLGLPIVYTMVERLHGTVTFTSSPSGTTFIIDLPIQGETR